MAYNAAVSLEIILPHLYESSDELANIGCPDSVPFIQHLNQMSISIQDFDFENEFLHLEKEIRDALWKAEGIISSYIVNHFLSTQEDIIDSSNFSQEIQEVVKEIESTKDKILFDKFSQDELNNGVREDIGHVDPSSDDFPPQFKTKMFGLDEELEQIKYYIFSEPRRNLGTVVIHGMGGIGKTCLAIRVYNDLDIRKCFPLVAWVDISLQHCARDILLCLLHSLEAIGYGRLSKTLPDGTIDKDDDEGLENVVRQIFAMDRYLVVVDCLCEMNESSWNYIKNLLPDCNNTSRIILVNRLKFRFDNFVFHNYKKRFLDTPQSWNLLKEQVFGDDPCPYPLERIGKRIVRNCKGLPLAIITVGLHLAKKEKTVEYWNKVAESGNSIAYEADGAPMFEQLGLSYKMLPQILRPIFLYMGAFPEGRDIPFSDLQILWAAEGFVKQYRTFKSFTWEWMQHLSDRNLVTFDVGENNVYTFSLHHALWYFCCYKAGKDEFFNVIIDKGRDDEGEDLTEYMNTNNPRRLVIRKAVLFGVHDIFKSDHPVLSGIHSLLFTGLYHPYPLTTILWHSYKMLRVLNARSIHFYAFPDEILCLSLLRYLALTLNGGELPSGLSNLAKLMVLIVEFHHIVRSSGGDPMYLPMEIWEMQQLQHLEPIGCDLPIPPRSEALLPNLETLCGVSPHTCRKEVLERIPNLTRLGIRIDLPPTNDGPSFSPFDHLAILQKLEWLDCMVTNPYFQGYLGRPQVDTMPETFPISMDRLTMLNLSGCRLPWESIKHISQLPSLYILNLHCRAFQGTDWKTENGGFMKLQALTMEDLDLVYWTASSGDDQFFPCLKVLWISHCHKLEQLPPDFVHCPNLEAMEVVNSSSAVESWARSLQTERSQIRRTSLVMSSPRGASATTM